MEAIRRREDDALVTASKAEGALRAAEARLTQLIDSQQSLIAEAQAQVGNAYRDVVEAFGSQSRAAEYLDISVSQLRAALATAPDVPTVDEVQTSSVKISDATS